METLLRFANNVLAVSVLAVLATVILAYPLADSLPMGAQIGAHIAILIFATTLKLSYVTRLVSLRSLGRPVH
jgi:tetrahydromethanopterin S-methyltransferase subunit E